MAKITKKELEIVKEHQVKLNEYFNRLGILEAQKHAMLHDFAAANKEVEEYKKVLEEKYGSININLEDGEYTKIEE
jgi:hypothetical protein